MRSTKRAFCPVPGLLRVECQPSLIAGLYLAGKVRTAGGGKPY
jgi:hypothetical protein